MPLRVVPHPKITTRNQAGESTGFLLPVWNVHEGTLPDDRTPQQLYVTVCAPGARKGPHLHLKRWGYFTCVKGNVRVIVRTGEGYEVAFSGDDHSYSTIEIPAGCPALIENLGPVDAYVINTPSPAWHKDDVDDHPVEGWDFAG